MEYAMIFYYLIYGASVALLMHKIAPLNKLLIFVTVLLWPVVLPIISMALLVVDSYIDEFNK